MKKIVLGVLVSRVKRLTMMIIALSLLAGLPKQSFSNGWMSESPTLKNGNLIAAKGLILKNELVDIVLLDKVYKASVTYTIHADQESFSGKMYFPILCKFEKYQTAKIPCVSDFSMSVNGEAVKVIKEPETVLSDFQKAFKAKVYDSIVIEKHIPQDSVMELNLNEGTAVYLYSFSIKPGGKDFSVTVNYQAPYFYTLAGTTKSSINYYSNDIVYYDFSPASSWVNNAVESIKVTVDSSKAKGTLVFPADWKFVQSNGIYTAELLNVRFANVPSLAFALDRKKQKQYDDHKYALKKHVNLTYSIDSKDTLSPMESYAPAKAMDDDMKTAWCSGKDNPEITITINPSAMKKDTCGFEGIGLINGYTKSAGLLKANRRIKSGTIEVEGEMKGKFNLPDTANGDPFNPYNSLSYIRFHDETFTILQSKDRYFHKTSSDRMKIRLTITDTYHGDRHNDVCITEIYPMFNCY